MTELEKTSIILPSCENKGNTRVGTARVRAALPKPIAVRHIRLHNEGESIMKKMEQTLIEPEKFYTIANGNGKVLEVKDYTVVSDDLCLRHLRNTETQKQYSDMVMAMPTLFHWAEVIGEKTVTGFQDSLFWRER